MRQSLLLAATLMMVTTATSFNRFRLLLVFTIVPLAVPVAVTTIVNFRRRRY